MTTYLAPVPATVAAPAGRWAHPARWLARQTDGKLALLASVESLAGCSQQDLVALARAADLVDVPEGTVLAEGALLRRFWWMPLDGWLLVSGEDDPSIAVPAGWSFTGDLGPGARISAVRAGRVLTCGVPALLALLDEHPKLDQILQATMVVPSNA